MDKLTRRRFLGRAAAAAGVAALGGSHRIFAQPAAPKPPAAKSRLVDIRNPGWLAGGEVQAQVVKKMVHDGVMALTGKKSIADAWKQFVEPNETVGIKYNGMTRDYTHTNRWVNDAIVEGLTAAGVKRERIIVTEGVGTGWRNAIQPDFRRGPEIRVHDQRTTLSRYILDQCDCIINVPDVKEHDRAGITCALKNLTHARTTIMEHPERFHGPGQKTCDPYLAHLALLGPIRTKRRLSITNGLKGVFHGGPWARRSDWQWPHNGFLIGTDALAIDKMCLDLVQAARRRKKTGIGPVDLFDTARKPIFIQTCHKMGVGCADLSQVQIIKLHS